jgi:hypothetical protein
MTAQVTTFEAYSYRVSARFGGRVQVAVGDGTVTITGPRLSLTVYRLWIVVQAVLLTLTFLAFLAALAFGNWRGLLAATLLLVMHLAAGGFGAGCLWELANLTAFIEGARGISTTFPPRDREADQGRQRLGTQGHVVAHPAVRGRHQYPGRRGLRLVRGSRRHHRPRSRIRPAHARAGASPGPCCPTREGISR